MSTVTTEIASALNVAEYSIRAIRPGELAIEVPAADLPFMAHAAVERLNARLLSLFGADERARRGRYVVHHVWSLPGLDTFLSVSAPVDPAAPSFPSIAARYPAAGRCGRRRWR